MEFKRYQHIERFGTTEVEQIELGECYIFPKLDGSNASVWLSDVGNVAAGSRNRTLTLENDNAGFFAWVKKQDHIKKYLENYPNHRLYGEWLVPHSLKTYKDEAWRNFYVFDVSIDKREEEVKHEGDSKVRYLHYNDYKVGLDKWGVHYIPPISTITNGSYEQFVRQIHSNVFMIKDGEGIGEGVVIKNYDFVNKYGRTTWAKIVTTEFKEKHSREMGPNNLKGKKTVEMEIAEKYTTHALCEKTKAKITLDNNGFSSRDIPQLLNRVYYDVVREDCWSFVKEHKNPTINFNTLKAFVFANVKKHLPETF